MDKSAICGTWHLKAFNLLKDGVVKPWRNGANGILIYSPDGFMSVSINSESSHESWLDTILFYAGTYEVHGDEVTHQVLNATSKDRINKSLVRKAVLISGILSLTAEGTYGKGSHRLAKIKIFLIVAGFGLFSSMSYSDELIEVLISFNRTFR